MNKITKVPTRVGYSLLEALYQTATGLHRAQENARDSSADGYSEYGRQQQRTLQLITSSDIQSFEDIKTFYNELDEAMRREKPMPTGSFISVAKHHKPQLKYVVTDSSCGLVVTTSMIKRLCELMCEIVYGVKYDGRTPVGVEYVISAQSYRVASCQGSINFLRMMDILQYFQEIDCQLMEISMEKFDVARRSYNRACSDRGYYNGKEDILAKFYPMLSDRYQDDSWKHYLKTHYSGMTSVGELPTTTVLGRNIALAELTHV